MKPIVKLSFALVAAVALQGCVPPSSDKDLTAFRFAARNNAALTVDVVGTLSGAAITAEVPAGTDVTALVATFTTTGVSVTVGGVPQVSGSTAHDFTGPVVYEVEAEDGTTADYTVTVTEAAGSAKELTAFRFAAADNPGLPGDVVGALTGTAVAATVPAGTDVTGLVASFTATGVAITVGGVAQVSGVTPNDFTTPVIYRVEAADGTTADYVVTVTEAAAGAKELTSFAFLAADNPALPADVTATLTGTAVSAVVPAGTDVTALVASFSTTGASVTVGGVGQVSGVTANDFTAPVTYVVHASDSTTADYTVTVTEGASAARALTAFHFLVSSNAALSVDIHGVITGAAVTATVPPGTDVTALVATFTTTGAAVLVSGVAQVSGVTANDFTGPVTYVVQAEDGSSADYTVTVSEGSATTWFGNFTIHDADDLAIISGYTEITGSLSILSDLTDLDGLASLTTVGDFLLLTNNLSLADTSGLAALTSVGGFLSISNNDALVDLDGLASLQSVAGHVDLSGNDQLVDIDGLSSLTSVGGDVEIVYNQSLQSLAGLGSLTTTPGALVIERNAQLLSLAGLEGVTSLGIGDYDVGLEIKGNDALTSLSGLDALGTVTGEVVIDGNDQLATLDGLQALTEVGVGLTVTGNPLLTTLAHLTSLTTVPSVTLGTQYSGGNASLTGVDLPGVETLDVLFVESNASLEDLSGLTHLASIHELYVKLNPALTTLGFGSAASSPTEVTGSIEIFRNAALEDLAGLEGTTALESSVRIVDNDVLESIAALDDVSSIGTWLRIGSVDFGGNPSLASLGFPSLESVGAELFLEDNDDAALHTLAFGSLTSVGGGITVAGNAHLITLPGLAGLTAIAGSLVLADNDELANLEGLAAVTSIGGNLVVENNAALDSLAGLELVTSIGGYLQLGHNLALLNLDGLSGLTSLQRHIEIQYNQELDNVDGLAGLTGLGDNSHILISSNPNLLNIDGLSGIAAVDGQVWVTSNGNLTRIDLSSLTAVPGDLRIQNNAQVQNLDLRALQSVSTDLILDNFASLTTVRFDALTSVGRHIYLRNIGGLSDLGLLAGVTAATSTLPGDLALVNNPQLADLGALAGLTAIGGYLDLTNNDSLPSLDALAGLTSIGASLWVRDNALVPDLHPLAQVVSIGGLLMIQQNASLADLGLDALASLTWDLYVQSNPSLCADVATALQDQLEDRGWTRTAYLSGNAGACP